jgi:hypothetical protein
MPEPRELLERVAQRVSPRPDAFERLVRARRRRERNRRIAAGILALAVAAAGIGGVVVAFRGAPRVVLGGDDRPFPGIWPERSWEEAEAAQARADAGEEAWRLQPPSVGYRFAEEVLGWGQPGAEVMVGEIASGEPAGGIVLRIHRFAGPCDPRAGDACPPVVAELELGLEQLIRRGEGGVWTVTEVDSPDIDLPVDPGATVRIGQRVGVTMRPPAFRDALVLAVGWHLAAPGCPRWTGVATGPATEGRVVLTPDALPEGCDPPVPAVLYAWMGERVGDLDPLLTPVGPIALEAIPVLFDVPLQPVVTTAPSPVPVIPVVGTIRCGEAGSAVRVVTPEFQPVEDGAHLEVVNEGGPRDVQILEPGGPLEWRFSLGAGELRRLVLPDLPPGEYRVYCLPAAPGAYASFWLVDPDGLWHAPELDCPGRMRLEFGHAGASGVADPTDAVRALPGVEGSDVVEYTGYPLASDALRIVRAGEVIAVVRLDRAEHGGWVVSSVESCSASGFVPTPG